MGPEHVLAYQTTLVQEVRQCEAAVGQPRRPPVRLVEAEQFPLPGDVHGTDNTPDLIT